MQIKNFSLHFICLILILHLTEGYSQGKLLTNKQLSEAPWYYDLSSANKNPEEVYNLSITWEKLEEFPEGIFKFINLQHLDLMDNNIRTIPAEIMKLKNLQILFLSNNKLSSLPEEMKNLENLEVLHLERNRLKEVPDWIRNIPKLKKVGLRDNKISAEGIEKIKKKYPQIEINN